MSAHPKPNCTALALVDYLAHRDGVSMHELRREVWKQDDGLRPSMHSAIRDLLKSKMIESRGGGTTPRAFEVRCIAPFAPLSPPPAGATP